MIEEELRLEPTFFCIETTFFFVLQEEREKNSGIHTMSDSDSKDSLSNTAPNGKKKKLKNGNKMLRYVPLYDLFTRTSWD